MFVLVARGLAKAQRLEQEVGHADLVLDVQAREARQVVLGLPGHEIEEEFASSWRKRLEFGADLAVQRWPIVNARHQVRAFHERADGFAGDDPGFEGFGEARPGPGDLDQRQQMIRTVFVEVVVIEMRLLQLHRVQQHILDFVGREVEPVFPDVAAFDVVVFADLDVVGHGGDASRVTARQAFPDIDHAAGASGVGAEVNDPVQQLHAAALLRIEFDQGVSEHRRRRTQKIRREDQRYRIGRH